MHLMLRYSCSVCTWTDALTAAMHMAGFTGQRFQTTEHAHMPGLGKPPEEMPQVHQARPEHLRLGVPTPGSQQHFLVCLGSEGQICYSELCRCAGQPFLPKREGHSQLDAA